MVAAIAAKSDLDSLLDLNRDYIRSVQRSDVARFNEILAPEFFCSNPDGSLVDRDGFLEQTAVPVRITDLSITEDAFDVNLNPIRAKVSLGMRVLNVNDVGFLSPAGSMYMIYQTTKEALAQQA